MQNQDHNTLNNPDLQTTETTYQVKVMTVKGLAQGDTWPTLPIIAQVHGTLTDLAVIVSAHLASEEVTEVRVNEAGILQGQYYKTLSCCLPCKKGGR